MSLLTARYEEAYVTIMDIRHSTGQASFGPAGDLADAHQHRPDARTRILDEAERLFRHYGYTKTTVADIARELGMSPANIYRFFASKAAVHEALADRMVAEREIAALQIARLPLPAAERLRIFIVESHKATVATMLDQQKVHEMVSVALDEQWPVIERHLDRMSGILAMIIKDGMASGEFAVSDPDRAARCFQASCISVCHPQVVAQCLAKANRATPEELAEFVIRALKV
jgi:AcrR family transcriptional regulator